MDRKQMVIKTGISLLCLAVLTACGGGGGSNFTKPESKFPGKQSDPNAPKTLPNVTADPSSNNFFTNVSESKDKGPNPYGGLQTKNIVVSLDHDKDGKINQYDRIDFNQVGVISQFCKGSSCPGLDKEKKALDKEIEASTKQIEDEKKKLADAEQVIKDEKASEAEKLKAEIAKNALENTIKDLEKAHLNLEEKKLEVEEADNFIHMVDVNSVLHDITTTTTVDAHGYPLNNSALHQDAGIVKLDGEWIINNKGERVLVEKTGFINRAYNGVVLFSNAPQQGAPSYLNTYLRDPSAAGWSYNTFGVFQGDGLTKARGIHRGYQSVGMQATDIPASGKASYSGISHAYYNNNQVTMNVKVNADFGKKSLSFNTNGATLHTFEQGKHYIEKKPELDLNGSAHWKNGSGNFIGNVVNADGQLKGEMNGSFYGPEAAEVGGVFGLQNESTQYLGGFGAKKN